MVAIQARSTVLHDPVKGLLGRALRKLRTVELIDKHLAISPINVEALRAYLSGISQLLVSCLQEFDLIGFRAGGAETVAGLAVDGVEVSTVEAVMKEFDGGGRYAIVAIEALAARP